jgi:hypothetical protein
VIRPATIVLAALALTACRGAAAPSGADLLEPGDFFIGDDALRDKAVEAPLGSFKRAAEGGGFYAIGDAVELYTKYAWRSRPAEASELVPGARVACFLSSAGAVASCGSELQRGPRTRAEAFTRQWVVATLRGAPERGEVSVGGCRCDVAGLRLVSP